MEKLINLLNETLIETDIDKKKKMISEFQNEIWNNNILIEEDEISEILSELAIDLDYYEPNPEWRREDYSYFGDEKLEWKIKEAISKIDKLRNK